MCANQALSLVESQADRPITEEKLGGVVLVEPGPTGPLQVSKAFQMHAPYVLEIQTTGPFWNAIFSFGRQTQCYLLSFYVVLLMIMVCMHEPSSKIFHRFKN